MSIRPIFGDGQLRACGDATVLLHRASWFDSQVLFDHRRWVCREVEMRWAAPRHLLVLTDAGRTAGTRVQANGRLLFDGPDRPGVFTFVPAGAERTGVYRDADLSYSALWIDPAWDRADRLADLPILVNRSDAVIGALIGALQAEIALGCRPDAAYVEHLVALLGFRLAALDHALPPSSSHGRLGRCTLARIRDYVDAHIADATLPIGTIAIRLGFSSQSHFTATFRRLRGTSPRAYRMRILPES
ncbi:helix-turn-helix domain-containing protein [Mycobacterium sp. KBS0706]|uniref:helix-turn-helix transcriptional regulator n=1 Tax=Mycobacterium sp. KBS0706 TaxID=2578109 RepID=UPI00110F6FBA|nr:helix-turn-helix domain-containing protein [Mycobacterium sp. KBS0706]TSD86823.1 helix-turn-helix domain-containing protein [Mycobacterium sp. KBS0706]